MDLGWCGPALDTNRSSLGKWAQDAPRVLEPSSKLTPCIPCALDVPLSLKALLG